MSKHIYIIKNNDGSVYDFYLEDELELFHVGSISSASIEPDYFEGYFDGIKLDICQQEHEDSIDESVMNQLEWYIKRHGWAPDSISLGSDLAEFVYGTTEYEGVKFYLLESPRSFESPCLGYRYDFECRAYSDKWGTRKVFWSAFKDFDWDSVGEDFSQACDWEQADWFE